LMDSAEKLWSRRKGHFCCFMKKRQGRQILGSGKKTHHGRNLSEKVLVKRKQLTNEADSAGKSSSRSKGTSTRSGVGALAREGQRGHENRLK